MPTGRDVADHLNARGVRAEHNHLGKGVAVNVFTEQRGTVASELSVGAMVVGMLVLAGLFVVAQVEGVSLSVLLHQLRHGH